MKKFLTFFILFLFISASAQKWKKNYANIMQSKSIYELDAFLKDTHEDDPRRPKIKERLIYLMEEYIKTAHPADQRVKELKEKLTLLETRSSTKISYEEMNDIIKKKVIEKYRAKLAILENPNLNNEEKEKALGNTTSENQQKDQKGSVSTNTYASSNTISKNPTAYKSKSKSSVVSNKDEEEEYNSLMNASLQEHKDKTVQILNKLFDNDPSSKDCIVMIQNNSDCNMIMRIQGPKNTNYKLAIPSKGENSIVLLKGDYQFSSVVCGGKYSSQKSIKSGMMLALGSPGK